MNLEKIFTILSQFEVVANAGNENLLKEHLKSKVFCCVLIFHLILLVNNFTFFV